ncbi:hypothetical protein BLOT_014864, partial [Blomia tropicalis]
ESYNGDIGLTKRDRDLNLLSESSPSLSNIKARLRDQHNDSVSFQLKSMASSNAGSTYLLPSTPSSNMKNSLVDTINDLHNENNTNHHHHQQQHQLDHSNVEGAKNNNNQQTYKDRRRNYRLEKKKMAQELISAIQDPTIIVMSDWLKIRTTYKQWNKYFCELRPGSLYLYKNQKTYKSSNWIGSVMLKMCELIERPSKKNGFCFKLFHPLEHPIWSPKGPHGEAFTSLMFPLPAASIIFRAPSEEAGRKWMEAIELSLKCSSLIVAPKTTILSNNSTNSAPNTPFSVGTPPNGTINIEQRMGHFSSALNSIDRSDDDIVLSTSHQSGCANFNDSEIEKHFDLCDDGHTDLGDDSQEHHSSDDTDDSFFEDEDDTAEAVVQEAIELNDRSKNDHHDVAIVSSNVNSVGNIVETPYIFDGGNEEFGLVGDAGQTEDVPEENKSLLWTLLKQVRPGMDLSKVVLPTFILEQRSFLEKLTDYYYHCDILSQAAIEEDPLLRMKLVLKWYLSGFYKKPKGLKKPYNPILGETFRCFWEHPETNSKTFYIAEQVSHHPPVSAFHVTNRKDGFCISGSILAKSKFYGNSISAILEGTAKLTLLTRDEEYLINFPYAHCKGIFLGPLAFELGGKITITCAKTGCKTELEFKLKPFFGSEDQCNLVQGKVRFGTETIATIEGHWDSEIWYKDKRGKGNSELFWSGIDPKVKSSRLRRHVVPIDLQTETESERLWHKVTLAIQQQNQQAATMEKTILEEAQREAVKQRSARMEIWTPNLFNFDTTQHDWLYKMIDTSPWNVRTDIRQYEHDYVIETLTRRLSKSNGQSIDRSALQKDQMKKSSVRKKFRIRRQITWADPSSGDYDYNENNKCGAQKLERGSSSLQTMIHSSLDNIESQLNSIKNTLTTLQREQDSLRNEMNQLNRCVRSQIDTTIIHAQSSSSSSSSLLPFYITRFRLRDATDFLPTEFKQVLNEFSIF